MQFSALFLLHALTYWVQILYMTLFLCTTEQVWVVVILLQFLYELCLFVNLEYSNIHSFPRFSLTCFDILSWNFAYDFVLLYYRSSLSVVNLRQFLWELCPFWNLEYWKYTVFRHFSLTPFNILSWKFAYDFVFMYHRASLTVVILLQFLYELCLFVNLEYSKIHSFPRFSLTCFDILSWNFAYDFVLLYYRSSSSVVNLRQFLWELCPFWNLEYWKYTVFRTFLLHPLTILSWKFAYDFVFMYYRSSLSVVNLRLFWSYASFRT